MASRASLSAVRRRSVSRLSHNCLPLARASSTFTRPFFEVHSRGNEGEPFLLRFADELPNLLFVDQELTSPQRGMIKDVAVIIRSDVAVQQPKLSPSLSNP